MTCETVQAACAAIKRIRNDYFSLLSRKISFNLKKLISPPGVNLDEFCKGYEPHPATAEQLKLGESFCQDHGIWLENSKHYITCSVYLYPTADFERLKAIVNNNVIDYYLNDTMGRDVFKDLLPRQKEEAAGIIHRMAGLDPDLHLSGEAHPVELANIEVLRYIRDSSPRKWFEEFLKYYTCHIKLAHRDMAIAAGGGIPSPEEYIDIRNHTSGMYHILQFIEYSTGTFLDWDLLDALGLAQPLYQLHLSIVRFGAISNDLFSFEKEVIDNDCEANFVSVLCLNHPEITLREAILVTCGYVQRQFSDYLFFLNRIRQRIPLLSGTDPAQMGALREHITGVERCMQTCWIWQVYSKRYKRQGSLFRETNLTPEKAG